MFRSHHCCLRHYAGVLQSRVKQATPRESLGAMLCNIKFRLVHLRGLLAEVRPLRWHDLSFAYRLARQGTHFTTANNPAMGSNPNHRFLSSTRRIQTYVLRETNAGGLGQLHHPENGRHAQLAFLAPAQTPDQANEQLWLCLLDGLTRMAGQRGAVNISAEVNRESPALETLRHADFAIYAYQDLWRRPPAPVKESDIALQLLRPDNVPAALALYSALTPGLIKQAENPPTEANRCYSAKGPGGLSGIVAVYRGFRGSILLEGYVRPEAQHETRGIINATLAKIGAGSRTVYYRLRRYLGWLDTSLDDLGFELVATQAFMVRHTAVRVERQVRKILVPMEEGIPIAASIDSK
jgi:hypothetical protein